jgi:uncharacterized membrane protein
MTRLKRNFLKACSWKIVSTTMAMAIAYAMTGSTSVAVAIALIHIPSSMVLYILHEYLWDRDPKPKKD